jgi:CubicO group peptidase (beta-lactamase class C family)
MQGLVDEGRLAGITTMIARRGRIVDFQTYGYRDIEAADSMREDAIFRIYSMSKPVTGVALMMLYEEGKFRLDDPVERYIPELGRMKVAVDWNDGTPVLEDPDHPMTIRELMSHTAGLAYGIGDPHPVERMYAERRVMAADDLAGMIDRLGELPLRYHPGERWSYSISVDVQGRLVEVLSGQPFDVFLRERLFEPLGMNNTGFHVPEADHDRFAQVYGYNESGALRPPPAASDAAPDGQRPYLDPTTFFSGGAGLVSTTMDYMRFSQMLLNGGELDGVRILSPLTVDLMARDHLPDVGASPGGLGDRGFGLNFAVIRESSDNGPSGRYYWGGAAGTWFWIDPVEDLVFVGMIQQFGNGRPDVRTLSERLTYQAITTRAEDFDGEE